MSNRQERRLRVAERQKEPLPTNAKPPLSRREFLKKYGWLGVAGAATGGALFVRNYIVGNGESAPQFSTPTPKPTETTSPLRNRVNQVELTTTAENPDWQTQITKATAELFADSFPNSPESQKLIESVSFKSDREYTDHLNDFLAGGVENIQFAPMIPFITPTTNGAYVLNSDEIHAFSQILANDPQLKEISFFQGHDAEITLTRSLLMHIFARATQSHTAFEDVVIGNSQSVAIKNFKIIIDEQRNPTKPYVLSGFDDAVAGRIAEIISSSLEVPHFFVSTRYQVPTELLDRISTAAHILDVEFLEYMSSSRSFNEFITKVQDASLRIDPKAGRNSLHHEAMTALQALCLYYQGAFSWEETVDFITNLTYGAGIPLDPNYD